MNFSQAIRQLVKEMHSKPAALVINGDLTDFGHLDQLELFEVVILFQFMH